MNQFTLVYELEPPAHPYRHVRMCVCAYTNICTFSRSDNGGGVIIRSLNSSMVEVESKKKNIFAIIP